MEKKQKEKTLGEKKNHKETKHYGAIDGLRAIAAIGIVMMHIAANNKYEISGFVYDRIIPSFTNFVFLFMSVSAFGMCCGYYEKVLKNQISVADFYKKRFQKILPFFAILVLIDVIISPSVNSLYEAFADLTLLFGLLPGAGNITVIGAGWFLGLIFVFYLCFPFFCYLIESKRRAWFAFAISLIYNFVCAQYFDVGRNNILYSGCFFLAGGLIYLYREVIEKINSWIALGMVAIAVVAYYAVSSNAMMCLLVSVMLLIYAVIVSSVGIKRGETDKCAETVKTDRGESHTETADINQAEISPNLGGGLQNRVTRFIGGISMEIYLSHMLVFRVIEKLHLNTVIGNGWLQYAVTVVGVLAGVIVFAVIMQRVIKEFDKRVIKGIKDKVNRRFIAK